MGEQNKNIFTDTTINGVPVEAFKKTMEELRDIRDSIKKERSSVLEEIEKSIHQMTDLVLKHAKFCREQGDEWVGYNETGHSIIYKKECSLGRHALSGYRWCKPCKEEKKEGGSPASKHEELLRSHREIVERSDKQKGKSNEIKLTEAEARLMRPSADAFYFINQEMSRCP